MKIRKTRPAASLVGRLRRQDDAFLYRRGRRRQLVVDAAAVRQHQRHDLLLDAVLVHLELFGLEVGDELVAPLVANDDVGRDEIDAETEGRLPWCGSRGLAAGPGQAPGPEPSRRVSAQGSTSSR